jgi:hypothetical protein
MEVYTATTRCHQCDTETLQHHSGKIPEGIELTGVYD